MPTLGKYLDKSPLVSYARGPNGLSQTGDSILWRGWFEDGLGLVIVKDAEFNPLNPTGYYVSGSDDVLTTNSMSFCFDSGSRVWAAFEKNNAITVSVFTGAVPSVSFSGKYPQVYYNSVSGGFSDKRGVWCFFTKPGQNNIYARCSSLSNFGTEIVVFQNFSKDVYRLNQIFRNDNYSRKITVYGLFSDSDGFKLDSDEIPYGPTTLFQNYASLPTGEFFSNLGFQQEEVEINSILSQYNVGYIDSLTTGSFSGYSGTLFSQSYMNLAQDSFDFAPTGDLVTWTGTNNMSGGFFIYG